MLTELFTTPPTRLQDGLVSVVVSSKVNPVTSVGHEIVTVLTLRLTVIVGGVTTPVIARRVSEDEPYGVVGIRPGGVWIVCDSRANAGFDVGLRGDGGPVQE